MINNNFIDQRGLSELIIIIGVNIIPIEDIIFIPKQSESKRIETPYDKNINNSK